MREHPLLGERRVLKEMRERVASGDQKSAETLLISYFLERFETRKKEPQGARLAIGDTLSWAAYMIDGLCEALDQAHDIIDKLKENHD